MKGSVRLCSLLLLAHALRAHAELPLVTGSPARATHDIPETTEPFEYEGTEGAEVVFSATGPCVERLSISYRHRGSQYLTTEPTVSEETDETQAVPFAQSGQTRSGTTVTSRHRLPASTTYKVMVRFPEEHIECHGVAYEVRVDQAFNPKFITGVAMHTGFGLAPFFATEKPQPRLIFNVAGKLGVPIRPTWGLGLAASATYFTFSEFTPWFFVGPAYLQIGPKSSAFEPLLTIAPGLEIVPFGPAPRVGPAVRVQLEAQSVRPLHFALEYYFFDGFSRFPDFWVGAGVGF